MTASISPTGGARKGRSVWAVIAGFLLVVVLSLVTDQLLHVLDVYPPWGQPMDDTGLNALALSYRIVYAILGSYVAARLAPRNPMLHAMMLGYIGLVPAIAGAVVAISGKFGPVWYPIALVLVTVPCAWVGGKMYEARR